MIRFIKAALIGLAVSLAIPVGSAHAQWTGCGMGVSGTEFSGLITGGGPVGLGAQGLKAGVLVNCDYKMQAFVMGVEASKSWSFGDLKTIGVTDDLNVMGRIGVLITPASLLYTHIDWNRQNISGAPFSTIDGWKAGLGTEFRIPNSPMYMDLRWSHDFFDNKNFGPSARVTADEVTLALKVKFGPGMFGQGGAMIDSGEVKPVCDGNVKKNC